MAEYNKIKAIAPEEYEKEYFYLLMREYLLNDVWSMKRIKDVITIVRPEPGDAILDAGCGWGTYAIEAYKRGAQVCGIDYASEAIQSSIYLASTVLGTNNIDFKIASVTKIPYPENTFKKIICADLIEHITQEDLKLFLTEATRVLKLGGYMCISTPNPVCFDLITRAYNKIIHLLSHKESYKWLRPFLQIGNVALGMVVFVFKNREIDSLCKQFHAQWLYPIIDSERFKRAREKYSRFHIELKNPSFVLSCLRKSGFKIKRIQFTRGTMVFQRMPYPIGMLWGGVYTILAELTRKNQQ